LKRAGDVNMCQTIFHLGGEDQQKDDQQETKGTTQPLGAKKMKDFFPTKTEKEKGERGMQTSVRRGGVPKRREMVSTSAQGGV